VFYFIVAILICGLDNDMSRMVEGRGREGGRREGGGRQ